MELVCPAGSLPALKAAVDNGANAVFLVPFEAKAFSFKKL